MREETSLTEPKHATSRQLVCDWADVSEDVLRLYVARRPQSGLSMAGLDRKALRGTWHRLRGLHGFRVQSPAQFRKTRAKGRIPPDPACRIKGNISPNGYIFHVPGQEYYEQTGITPTRGERWFCSAAEARAAGWRAARR